MITSDKIAIIRYPDGSFSTMIFFYDPAIRQETEDEFISGEVARYIETVGIKDVKTFIGTKDDLRQAILDASVETKRFLKCDSVGKFYSDPSYKTLDTVKQEKLDKLTSKLTALGFDSEDIQTLLSGI